MKLLFKKCIFIAIVTLVFPTIIVWFSHGEETLYYWENNIFNNDNLDWIRQNQSDVRFKYWWNNFWWLFFITKIQNLSSPQTIRLWTEIKKCNKQIYWIYYNNQRGVRFWPLDHVTLNVLKNNPWNGYDDLELDWGFFTDCEDYNKNQVYWEITHTIQNYKYELIAWVELNFGWNTYLSIGQILNLPRLWQSLKLYHGSNWIFLSWHVFDNYGWIWMVYGSWEEICIGTRQVDPSKICSWDSFIQYDNCGNTRVEYWTKKCDPDDTSSAWIFCKYDDEKYLQKWAFTDTRNHRWFNYIEVMRKSCLHRWKWTNRGEWIYYPDDYIKRSEVLKTLVKIRWIAFDNFQIESEDKIYPFDQIFEDVPKNYWFARYTNYAFTHWLTDWLYGVSNNKKYLDPENYINRYQAVRKIIETYNAIYPWEINLNSSTNLTDISTSNPYYTYIIQAESLWIIQWYRQKDWTYQFKWDRFITRAEFAKIISIPFMLLLSGYER